MRTRLDGWGIALACVLSACTSETSEGGLVPEPAVDRDPAPAPAAEPAPAQQLGSGETEAPAPVTDAVAREISFNHPQPHALRIPASELGAASARTYWLTEGGGAFGETHSHSIKLSREQLDALRSGLDVAIETSAGGARGGHTHVVSLSIR